MNVTGSQPVTPVEGGSMVKTRTTTTRRRAARPPRASALPTAPVVRPAAEFRSKLEFAGRKLRLAGRMTRRFGRTTVREVTTAVRESREPMRALFRNVRLAGRHITREAVQAWQGVMPMPVTRPSAPRRARA
jgi:hypothetical protein